MEFVFSKNNKFLNRSFKKNCTQCVWPHQKSTSRQKFFFLVKTRFQCRRLFFSEIQYKKLRSSFVWQQWFGKQTHGPMKWNQWCIVVKLSSHFIREWNPFFVALLFTCFRNSYHLYFIAGTKIQFFSLVMCVYVCVCCSLFHIAFRHWNRSAVKNTYTYMHKYIPYEPTIFPWIYEPFFFIIRHWHEKLMKMLHVWSFSSVQSIPLLPWLFLHFATNER